MKLKKEIVLFFVFLILFLTIACCVYQNSALSQVELNIIKFVQSCLKDVPLSIPVWLTDFGHGQIRYYLIFLVIVFLFIYKKFKDVVILLFSMPVVEFIYSSLKLVVARPRPPEEIRLIVANHYSFPSGHSVLSMVLYGLFIFFVCKYVKNKILKNVLVSILSILIFIVGFTRVWLGVHFPIDVLGGFSLGICFICVCALISNIEFKSIFSKRKLP